MAGDLFTFFAKLAAARAMLLSRAAKARVWAYCDDDLDLNATGIFAHSHLASVALGVIEKLRG